MALQVDRYRAINADLKGATGIYIRAKLDDRFGAYDIATLTKESLLEWLRSHGGANELAENVVGLLLGHGHLHGSEKEEE